jgi:hypothetical protein
VTSRGVRYPAGVTNAPSRRSFLTGAAGLTLPLPFLSSLAPGCVGEPLDAHPLVVVRAASGVAQKDAALPEKWWPRALGPLTRRGLLETDRDRVTSELAPHAERLQLVRGTKYPFPATRELHAGGGNQLLTAARPGPLTDTVMTFATGESIDSWIARRSEVNGGEPLTLYAGRRDDYGEEVLSYRGPLQLRAAESDPWTVYRRLIGADALPELRGSVNDHVLDQLDALRRSPRLSSVDRDRLDLHTDSVRDFEVLCERANRETERRMSELTGLSSVDDVSLDVARLHCDLVALVLACDRARAITLQIGDRLDRCHYTYDGFRLPQYHELTHGLVPPGSMGPYATTHDMHADINRLHLRLFVYLLDRLVERDLLDRSVVVFTSDVSTGSHRYDNLPWVVAGRGDGTLRPGRYVDAGDVTHDLLLCTLLTATGHRRPDGGPITRFGDPELTGGLVSEMMRG